MTFNGSRGPSLKLVCHVHYRDCACQTLPVDCVIVTVDGAQTNGVTFKVGGKTRRTREASNHWLIDSPSRSN